MRTARLLAPFAVVLLLACQSDTIMRPMPESDFLAKRVKPPSTGFVSISAGGQTEDSHTCAIRADQKAYCWGKASRFGQLGSGFFTNSPTPVAVATSESFSAVEAGGYYTCGMSTGGSIYCWGYNAYGQLGDGTQTSRPSPVAYAGGISLESVTVGSQTSCGIDGSQSAHCWGWGRLGERGDGVLSEVQVTPVAVQGGHTFALVEIGAYHTCGLNARGDAYCWGNNGQGQLGTDEATGEVCSEGPCASTPLLVQGGLRFKFVEPGGVWAFRGHTCGLLIKGKAYCWGRNDFGQLGDGTTNDKGTPTPVSGRLNFSSLSTHGEFTCGLTKKGRAHCWGHNDFGQLGNGTTTDSPVPVPVAGGLKFVSVDAGAYHACGVTANGEAYCWGRNNDGQLGNGTTVNSSIPLQVLDPPASTPNFALDFNQSYVNVPDDNTLDLTTSWTLEAWVFPRAAGNGVGQDIISKWDGGGNASYIMQIDGTGVLRLVTHDGTNTVMLSRTHLTNNTWQHVAATFSNGTVGLYIDGVLDTTITNAVTPMNSTQPVAFGREGNYAGGTLNGIIDEVRIWNVARSGADLATFRTQRLAGTEVGLVGYWRFDEGAGDVAFDATGNGNNGRLGTSVGVDAWDPQWTSVASPIP